jgi:hypothetical protein
MLPHLKQEVSAQRLEQRQPLVERNLPALNLEQNLYGTKALQ